MALNGSQNLSDTTRLFYSAGAGWSPTSPGSIQLGITVGAEQQLNHGKLTDTKKMDLEARSAKYLGATFTAGLSTDIK